MKIVYPIALITAMLLFAACNPPQGQNEAQLPDETHTSPGPYYQLAGQTWALAYSGFRTGQHPDRGEGAVNPTYEQTLEDLQILSNAGCGLIRLYDSGENSQLVLKVISENKLPIKVMLGIWLQAEVSNHLGCPWLTEPIPQQELDENILENQAEIEKAIELANTFQEVIVALNVGNEALVDWNDHMVTIENIMAYVKQVKQSVSQEVTVADNYKWWALYGKELATLVDFVSIHIYPVWEGKSIEQGLSYSLENIKEVQDSLPGAKIVITEAGWPTTASEFGEQANEENQQRYITELMDWATQNKITTFIFEAFDEDWKGDPTDPMGAEKHWGLYFIDRTPKLIMQHELKFK